MSGTNIFTHASDEAKYVYLQPFTSPGSAFEAGGDVQSILEQIDPSALLPLPPLPYATPTEDGAVEYSTQAEANALDDLLTVLTPETLDGVDQFVSPATDTQLGNLLELRSSDLTRTYASSDDSRLLSYRRLEEMMTTRNALADDTTNESQGFAQFATLAESLAYNPSRIISPMRTWNLIKKEIPNPWAQATETSTGVVRTVAPSDSLKSDASIAISVKGLNHVSATTSKRGAFKLTQNNYDRNASDANEYAITPGTIDNLLATSDKVGFFQLPATFTNDSTQATSAALGYELANKLGPDGGTITGTLQCDNIYSNIVTRQKQYSYGGSYYVNVRETREVFPNNQLDAKIGLAGRPVGSIFHCTENVDPNVVFGGVWYRIRAGQTMIGQGTGDDGVRRRYFSAGTYRDDDRVTLYERHLPSHSHKSWGETYSGSKSACVKYGTYRNPYGVTYYCKEYSYVDYWRFGKSGSRNNIGMGSTDRDNYMYYTSPVGGGQAHENMMPFYPVYIWRRVK
ncbi:hypothetical protein COHAPHLL_00205 [Vibrio phage V09]|uniref:Baseplate structural protein Gp10 C-terminal domain-containing protein n=1 Tax=Vibrio phage V09 TaxID=2724327 RepID=A0A6H0X9H1_9CAUD|nr:hypothetical protein COHAPHLL_00205 [Vibrio phage V09]